MDLYNVDVVGETSGARFSNRYKVVADSVCSAVHLAEKEMKEKHKLNSAEIVRVEFVESGIIV